MPVLVAYDSRFGSTKGVAERIAMQLRQFDLSAELLQVEEVSDPAEYDAVVLGSAVFNGRWLPSAEQFVDQNQSALASRPLWMFSVGTFGDTRRIIGPLVKREPRTIHAWRESCQPRDYRVFAGVIDRRQWPFLSRLFLHALGGRLGDNRDWPEIESWAREIGRELQEAGVSR